MPDENQFKFQWTEKAREKTFNWSLGIYPSQMDRLNKAVHDLKISGHKVSAPKLVRRMIDECLTHMGYPPEEKK